MATTHKVQSQTFETFENGRENSLALFKSLSKRRYGVVDLTIVGTKEEISKARQLLDPDQVALFEIQEEWLEREKMGVQAASYS